MPAGTPFPRPERPPPASRTRRVEIPVYDQKNPLRAAMFRCLLVDDDAEIRAGMQRYLQNFGFDVTAVGDGAGLRRAFADAGFDVVVLDLLLPDEGGIELCKWIRSRSQAPVLMLTALDDPISRVLGLELGADDYMTKPFEPRELVARLHAVLRRSRRITASDNASGNAGDAVVHFANWRFDRHKHQLQTTDDVVVPLSTAEYRLLSAFVQNAGRVLSRDRLIELTRAAGVEVNDRAIDLAVSRLRSKLGDPPRDPQLIRTVRGEGYLFGAKSH
jgi:two-component system OmpR family response regulator